MTGLLRYGGIAGVLAAGSRMQSLERSPKADDRLLLANVIGDVAAPGLYQPLGHLLEDSSLAVRRAALEAAGRLRHDRLLDAVLANLDDIHTRSAASAALVAYGEKIVSVAAEALVADVVHGGLQELRIVRLCGQVGGQAAVDLLSRHLDNPSARLRQELFAALSVSGFRATTGEAEQVRQAMQQEMQIGAEILAAQEELGQSEGVGPLRAALDDEWEQVRRRIFLLLSFIYDARTILRAEAQLKQVGMAQQAMVLEMLDQQLSSGDKRLLFPFIDPRLDKEQRLKQLTGSRSERLPQAERLQGIIKERGNWSWPDWVKASAIYAAGSLGCDNCIDLVEAAVKDETFVVQETAVWALARLAPERLKQVAGILADNEDSRLLELVRQLSAG